MTAIKKMLLPVTRKDNGDTGFVLVDIEDVIRVKYNPSYGKTCVIEFIDKALKSGSFPHHNYESIDLPIEEVEKIF